MDVSQCLRSGRAQCLYSWQRFLKDKSRGSRQRCVYTQIPIKKHSLLFEVSSLRNRSGHVWLDFSPRPACKGATANTAQWTLPSVRLVFGALCRIQVGTERSPCPRSERATASTTQWPQPSVRRVLDVRMFVNVEHLRRVHC